ncbi:MAG: hypothetical protein LBC11_03925 [Puniceicoccales bacterium]|nr:hypothetical protein [Puniceicoccales bacterium]
MKFFISWAKKVNMARFRTPFLERVRLGSEGVREERILEILLGVVRSKVLLVGISEILVSAVLAGVKLGRGKSRCIGKLLSTGKLLGVRESRGVGGLLCGGLFLLRRFLD